MECGTRKLRNLNTSQNNPNSNSNVLTQLGNNRSTLFHTKSMLRPCAQWSSRVQALRGGYCHNPVILQDPVTL